MTDTLGKYTVSEQGDQLLVKGVSINDKTVGAPAADPLVVNGAWYIEALPNNVVAELADGSLAMFQLTPFRAITLADLHPYKGYHPRKCKGQPLPDYLYRYYGLAKNAESATEVIHVRVTPSEKAAIETYAANLEPRKSVSEVLREYIRNIDKEGTNPMMVQFMKRDLLREFGIIGHVITDPISDPLFNNPRYDWESAWPVVRSADDLEIVGVATGDSEFDEANIVQDCYIVEANVSNYI